MRKRRRSRESIERLRRQRVADLKHLLRCCRAGLLPEVNCATVESVPRDEANLPPMDELGARVGLTNKQREEHKLWTIPPADMTAEQLREHRKRKDRERKRRARLRAGAEPLAAYRARVTGEQPWKVAGISKATWYRRKGKSETGSSGHETGSSARISYRSGHTCLTHQVVPQQEGLQAELDRWPDVDLHGRSV